MRTPVPARWLALGVSLFAANALGDAPFVKVIQPGAEALAGRMLLGAIGGCRAVGVALDRTVVVARYECGGGERVVELHHPGDAAGAVATTAQFAIVARGGAAGLPAGFLDELARRIRAVEGDWRWISAEAPGLGTVPSSVSPTPSPPEPGLSPVEADAFVAAAGLYRQKRYPEAFDAFVTLARQTPRHGVLGMIVASLASTSPGRARVVTLAAAADAQPADPLPQFIAGVGAHYCGHRNGKSLAEKQELYRLAIKYLSRARPAFDFEPRVYVYLAVSHFRLGEQKEAAALIEAAIPLAQNDPDVYYCRAEIFQRADVTRSIADIERYLAMTSTLQQQGVPVSEDKHARVKAMLEYLKAVQRGERKALEDDSLFDPILDANPAAAGGGGDPLAASQHGGAAGDGRGAGGDAVRAAGGPAAPLPMFSSPGRFALALGLLALAAGLALGLRALRRRPG